MSEQENLRSYQKIAALIQQNFITADTQIGDKLPSEREFAEYFNISRTLVREALIMLEIEGLVTIKKGSGVFVEALQKKEQQNSLYEEVGPFELLQARQLIESSIAEFAAINVKPNDILILRNIVNQEKAHLLSNNKDNDYSEDEQFHLAIVEITQNTVLIELQKEMWKYRSNKMWKKLHSHIIEQDYRNLWLQDHEKIFQAIQRRDPMLARKAMWEHLENVKNKLFELSDIDADDFDGFLYQQSPVSIL